MTPPDRSPPHSAEAEEHVIACCLLDGGDTLRRAIDEGIREDSFYLPANRLLFTVCRDLAERKLPVELTTLAEELKTRRQLEAVGGFAYLMQVTGKIPTTAHAGYFIEKVREKHLLREAIKTATGIVEQAYGFTGGLDEFLSEAQARIGHLASPMSSSGAQGRRLGTFNLPPKNDPSILIGNRWLSRGDIGILASTSGMGKSSLSIQAAVTWALGRPLFDGMKPNGALKSLIIQAEDGDGDIAEVRLSLEHAMALTEDQKRQVNENVIIVTDRTHRGLSFRRELQRLLALHKPDIVWINPLLAFIGGDVNDSMAVGAFLREQLNSLNEPATFAYIIVHHTAKPPKEKKERQWNEVMYEMAGSADLTNAARAIIALQATEKQGEFKLVLAKRGPRAGFTQKVPGTVNPDIKFEQPTSIINVRHSTARFKCDGQDLPVIHWERCEEFKKAAPIKTGRPSKYSFDQFSKYLPKPGEPFKGPNAIHRVVSGVSGISASAFREMLAKAAANGLIECHEPQPGNVSYGYSVKTTPISDPVWENPVAAQAASQ